MRSLRAALICADQATECRLVVGRLFREQVFESSILSTPTVRRRRPNWQRLPSQKRYVEGSNPSVGTNHVTVVELAYTPVRDAGF